MPHIFPKYSLAAIPNWEGLLTVDTNEVNSASATLINCMPMIGVTEISDENLDDVWWRICLLQTQVGGFVCDPKANHPFYLTYNDLVRHLGLRVEGANQSISEFWNYFLQQRLKSELTDQLFVTANGGKTLLELCGVK